MIFAIDLGNTNVTFGCIEESTGDTVFEERINTDHEKTSIEYAVAFKTIMDIRGVNANDVKG